MYHSICTTIHKSVFNHATLSCRVRRLQRIWDNGSIRANTRNALSNGVTEAIMVNEEDLESISVDQGDECTDHEIEHGGSTSLSASGHSVKDLTLWKVVNRCVKLSLLTGESAEKPKSAEEPTRAQSTQDTARGRTVQRSQPETRRGQKAKPCQELKGTQMWIHIYTHFSSHLRVCGLAYIYAKRHSLPLYVG